MTNLNDEFFVILPSDSNLNIHSENKNNKYIVEFETPIELSDEYECALLDINIPRLLPQLKTFPVKISYIKQINLQYGDSWDFAEHSLLDLIYNPKRNITYDEFISDFELFLQENISKTMTKQFVMDKILKKQRVRDKLPANYNYTPPKFESWTSRDRFDEYAHKLKFNHGILAHVRYLHIHYRIVFIFEEDLYKLLRVPEEFSYPFIHYGKGGQMSSGQADSIHATRGFAIHFKDQSINENFRGNYLNVPQALIRDHIIVILSDMIGESHINGNKKRILKILNSDDDGNIRNVSRNIQFFPVIRKTIKNIQIEIVDLNWENIQFKNGPVNLVMYLRKK